MEGQNLRTGEVYTVLLDVAACEPLHESLAVLLNVEERARAASFLVHRARQEFIVGRGVLRLLLGKRLGGPPQEIAFSYGSAGKPCLADAGSSGCWFNLSHSAGVIAISLSDAGEVGVDVERVDPGADVIALASTAWGAGAAKDLALVADPAEQRMAFFRRWVRHEAKTKCSGLGWSMDDTNRFDTERTCVEWAVQKDGDIFMCCVAHGINLKSQPGTWISVADAFSFWDDKGKSRFVP